MIMYVRPVGERQYEFKFELGLFELWQESSPPPNIYIYLTTAATIIILDFCNVWM